MSMCRFVSYTDDEDKDDCWRLMSTQHFFGGK